MSSSQETSSFTFNLPVNKPGKSNDNDANMTVAYIIQRNQALDDENKQLRQELAETNQKVEEEEEYNDSNQKKNNNMRMMLKNFVETKKLQEKILILKDDIIKTERNKTQHLLNNGNYKSCIILILLMITAFNYLFTVSTMGIIFSMLVQAATSIYCYYTYQYEGHLLISVQKHIADIKKDIKACENQIKDINLTNDYLDDYIDMI
jgi:hypothetical protein